MASKNRRKQDNFLRNVLIIFGSVFVVLFAVMVYFNITELKYDDFQEVGTYDDVDNMPEDVYAVYYYSTSCGACNTLKSAILEFADENALGLKVYLLGYEKTSEVIPGSKQLITGPQGQKLTHTPTLMIYKDGTMVDFYVGGDVIADLIDDINNGDYTID